MASRDGWTGLFAAAFRQSRNPMVLLDADRRQVEVNGAYLKLLGYRREQLIGRPLWEFVADGPLMDDEQWRANLAEGRFTGTGQLIAADGSHIGVQFAATVETVTGRRLVLVVALSTSRAGAHFRRQPDTEARLRALSARERQIVRLVAMGSTGPEIAEELRISHNTVRTHVRSAMEKSGARSRAHLVAKALGLGIILEEGSQTNGEGSRTNGAANGD